MKNNIVGLIIIIFSFYAVNLAEAEDIYFQGDVYCNRISKLPTKSYKDSAACILVETDKKKYEKDGRIISEYITDDIGNFTVILPSTWVYDKKTTITFSNNNTLLCKRTKYFYREEVIQLADRKTILLDEVFLEPNSCVQLRGKPITCEDIETCEKKTKAPALVGSGRLTTGLLSYLGTILSAGVVAKASVNEIPSPPTLARSDGKLFSYAFSVMNQNLGFQLAPSRNISDAVFFNASSISMSSYGQGSLFSNFKSSNNYSQFGIVYKVDSDQNFGVGFGGIYVSKEIPSINSSSPVLTAKEYAINVAGSMSLQPNLSFGVIGKYISQEVESHIDIDLSVTYRAKPSIYIGISGMNLLGSELITIADNEKIRALGIGCNYLRKKLNVGGDVKVSEDGEWEAAIGMNYVPFDDALISLGFSPKFDTYSIGVEYKWLTYRYNKNEVFNDSHFLGLKINF